MAAQIAPLLIGAFLGGAVGFMLFAIMADRGRS